MQSQRLNPRYAVSIAIVAVALLIPFSFTPDAGAVVNDACADGACCPEIGAFCGYFVDNYTSDNGKCGLRPRGSTTTTSENSSGDG